MLTNIFKLHLELWTDFLCSTSRWDKALPSGWLVHRSSWDRASPVSSREYFYHQSWEYRVWIYFTLRRHFALGKQRLAERFWNLHFRHSHQMSSWGLFTAFVESISLKSYGLICFQNLQYSHLQILCGMQAYKRPGCYRWALPSCPLRAIWFALKFLNVLGLDAHNLPFTDS